MINIQAFLSVAVDFARLVCLIKIAVFVIIIQKLKAVFSSSLISRYITVTAFNWQLQNDVQAATTSLKDDKISG